MNEQTTSDISDVFSTFHDGRITSGKCEAGVCELGIDIEYLAERINPDFRKLTVKLHDFTDFKFSPWLEEGKTAQEKPITFEEFAGFDLGILSAELPGEKNSLLVHCNQDFHDLGFTGGNLEFSASKIEIFDEKGSEMSVADLKKLSREYWDEWKSE